jgi:hypothetical protein
MSEPHSPRVLKALEYYSLENISPRDPVKINHPSNAGWTEKTIDEALDAGLITCGKDGWHVLTDAGKTALGEAKPVINPSNPSAASDNDYDDERIHAMALTLRGWLPGDLLLATVERALREALKVTSEVPK